MPGVRGHLGQCLEVVRDEAGLQHEVLGRVAGDRQFGERDDVATGRLGLVVGGDDLGDVAVEVAVTSFSWARAIRNWPQGKASDQPPSK